MSSIDECPVCSNPDAATWRERYDHGCPKPGEVWRCEWCGEPHEVRLGEPGNDGAGGKWCSEKCHKAHEAANPNCEWFRGFVPSENTLPGGALDGILEESGLRFEQQ